MSKPIIIYFSYIFNFNMNGPKHVKRTGSKLTQLKYEQRKIFSM